MNKYTKLLSNTVIFAIGTFGSKILVFLLMPLYTRVLTSSDYGVVDLIIQTSNLLIPLASFGIANAVIRFGLDRSVKKSDVFSTGIITILCGFILLIIFSPLINKIEYIGSHGLLIYVYVLTSCMRTLCSQFTRAKQYVRLYAFDGVLSTVTIIIFNILFLVVFKWGITGYVLAIIMSDFLSSVFLFWTARLWRYVDFKSINASTSREMLKYAVPMIPANIFWWIINVSNRFIVAYMLGSDMNGLYAVAYKIPTIVALMSNIFMEAWQMSAISENNKGREKFFTTVFGTYQSLIFLTASGIILFAKVATKILVSDAFYPSWQYIPFLVTATAFSCLVTFLGSVYIVEKKSMLTLITTVVGAVINVAMTFVLIPKFGVNGAAFATFLSYLTVFVLRAVNTRKFIKIDWDMQRLVYNAITILLQCFVMIYEIKFWVVYEIILVLCMMWLNLEPVLGSALKIVGSRRNRPDTPE